MNTYLYTVSLCLCMFILGCSATRDTVTQTSTIDALLAGHYDGTMECRELLTHGNLGIGTFDKLDGEMLILDGEVYQIKVDGKVYQPNLNTTTPFASVCQFDVDKKLNIESATDFNTIQTIVDGAVSNKNIFCAVRINGKFDYVKTRSVPAQSKPYTELAEVTKTQTVFEMHNISGTIVGFRCPDFVEGVNVPGYHLHFISDDKTKGGHLLECTLKTGTAKVDVCNNFLLLLPKASKSFSELDLSKDRSKELQAVER